MVDYTPTHSLPYPAATDSVLPEARDFQNLAITVDAALVDLDVRNRLWFKGALDTGQDFNNVTTVGAYAVQFTTHPNAPVAAAGFLEVFTATGIRRLQRFTTNEPRPRMFWRTANLDDWNNWAEGGAHLALTSPVDFDTLTTPGFYGTAFSSHPNAPVAAGGYLEVLSATGIRRIQRFTTNEAIPRHFERTASLTGWNAWQNLDSGTATGTREGAYRLLSMRERVNNATLTTPAAVAIVMDHGLTNVKSKVVAAMRARGLTATLAINSQRWNDANNSGATQADVRGWGDVFEFANHGRTHNLTGNEAHDLEEIEGGREELEAQLQVPIDTWVQTGNTAGSYPFDDGRDESSYWDTATGQIIARTHAVSTGLVAHPSRLYSVDGHPRFGAHGFWLDNGAANIAAAQAAVTDAITQGKRIILRLHPQFIDQSGYITTAQLTGLLDWLVTQRTAGNLTVMTYRKWQIVERDADATAALAAYLTAIA